MDTPSHSPSARPAPAALLRAGSDNGALKARRRLCTGIHIPARDVQPGATEQAAPQQGAADAAHVKGAPWGGAAWAGALPLHPGRSFAPAPVEFVP